MNLAETAAAPFLFEITLPECSVEATPQPFFERGCAVGFAGYLERATADDVRLDRCARLLRRYEAEGENLSRSLLGQYAAVVVDTRAKRVVLVQDSLGLRTLYYAFRDRRLVVSASLIALVDRLGATELDEAYFAEYLASAAPSLDKTPFRDVSRLSGGTSLVVTPSRRTVSRPWAPQEAFRLEADPAQKLRELLDAAVAAALPREGTVVCELSGGLDSSSVFLTAQRLRPPIEALTLFSGDGLYDPDDEAFSAQIVAETGTVGHRLDMDRFPPFSIAPEHLRGEPGGESLLAIQRGYTDVLEATRASVVLTGIPGDPVFGYGGLPPFHLADALVRGRPLEALRAARGWAGACGDTRPWTHYLFHYGMKPALQYARRRSLIALQAGKLPAWLSRDFLRRSGIVAGSRPQLAALPGSPGRQYLWESIYRLANTEAVSAFRTNLRVQTRHPLFHRPLVEFMLGLPPALRAHGTRDRVLQREALRDRLPESVRTRLTKGGDQRGSERALAASDWTRVPVRESRIVANGWVDGALWGSQLARARFGQFEGAGNFYAALTTEYWLRTWESHRARREVR